MHAKKQALVDHGPRIFFFKLKFSQQHVVRVRQKNTFQLLWHETILGEIISCMLQAMLTRYVPKILLGCNLLYFVLRSTHLTCHPPTADEDHERRPACAAVAPSHSSIASQVTPRYRDALHATSAGREPPKGHPCEALIPTAIPWPLLFLPVCPQRHTPRPPAWGDDFRRLYVASSAAIISLRGRT